MHLSYVNNALADFESRLTQDKPLLGEEVDRLISSSSELRRRLGEPVRVGIIGEFSAGKSLLIGGLLGRADILPTSEIPTTGNITELLISQGKNASTEVHKSTIHFIASTEVKELFIKFYRELLQSIKNAGVDDNLLRQGKLFAYGGTVGALLLSATSVGLFAWSAKTNRSTVSLTPHAHGVMSAWSWRW